MIINFQAIIFYAFAALLLGSAVMAVSSRFPVRGVLFLVLAFFASSVLWMTLQVEFLALVLIFVYVGAVMTLFLFVVMMLNLDTTPASQRWVKTLPFGLLILAGLLFLMHQVINSHNFSPNLYSGINYPENYSNVKELGSVLYNQYVYPFELAAVLLLVAIVAAICLAFRGRLRGTKAQRIERQLAVNPEKRVRLISMPSEKP